MKKLKLDVETLAVQTFETGEERSPGRGTVEAHDAPTVKTICANYCGTLLASNPTCCPCTPMY